MTLVSIIIPCYNAERWLAETLASATGQSWPDKEIIVVDDGSTDRSLEIAQSHAGGMVRVLTQANAGASAARNRGLDASTGQYIQFLDADDLLAPDKIERQMQLAATVRADTAIAATWARFHSSIHDASFVPEPLSCDANPIDWTILKLEHHRMMHPAAWLVARSLLHRAGRWDESLSLDDDGEFFTRVVLTSSGVRNCAGAISYYRSRIPGSLSRLNSERGWTSAWRSLELSADQLLGLEDSPRTRHACATAMQRFVYESYPEARPWRREAQIRIARLGGTELQPDGGPRFQLVRRVFGWRIAKRLMNASRRVNQP